MILKFFIKSGEKAAEIFFNLVFGEYHEPWQRGMFHQDPKRPTLAGVVAALCAASEEGRYRYRHHVLGTHLEEVGVGPRKLVYQILNSIVTIELREDNKFLVMLGGTRHSLSENLTGKLADELLSLKASEGGGEIFLQSRSTVPGANDPWNVLSPEDYAWPTGPAYDSAEEALKRYWMIEKRKLLSCLKVLPLEVGH